MKKALNDCVCLTVLFMIAVIPDSTLAREKEKSITLEQITVTAPKEKEAVAITPQSTTINVDDYKTVGTPQNIVDVLKDRVIIDFRGESDLVPTRDDIKMRGFDAHRFTMAMDGLTIDYGRSAWSGTRAMVLNPATLPLGEIESIEIIPGPHSALYGGKSEGGVVNLKTKTPKRYGTLKPDFRVTTGYRSYNTQNHSVNANGGVGSFVYGLGYQDYHTDGYLRSNLSDIKNYSARLGYVFPSDGYITLDTTYTDLKRELTVKNAPGHPDYDDSYPETPDARYWPWQKPKRHEEYYIYRLHYKQPTPLGLFTIGGYAGGDSMEMNYSGKLNSKKTPAVKPDDIQRYSDSIKTRQTGGKIQDEIDLFENNALTLGFDTMQIRRPERFYRGFKTPKHKQADLQAWYLQDKWEIIPGLTWIAGARYEKVKYWRHNWDSYQKKPAIPEEGTLIRRHWNQVVPKSFLTYALDDLSDVLRDTSVSFGVSKIWNPLPFCYG